MRSLFLPKKQLHAVAQLKVREIDSISFQQCIVSLTRFADVFLTGSVVTTIYQSFDRICLQYGMTRVKTLDNSYMVLSGPIEKESMDHAISMIHFVVACQNKVEALCANPVHELEGNVTRPPLMRYSIHSGSDSLMHTLKIASFLGR
jgi:Adenylate and Guanylate cyclase catalytic domain